MFMHELYLKIILRVLEKHKNASFTCLKTIMALNKKIPNLNRNFKWKHPITWMELN
jgi:hypothetical protein